MGEKLRFGILSTGNIARQFATGVRESDRCVVQAVGSRSQESAAAFAEAHAVPAAYGSYDQLLADPNIDAVYIGLPNTMHYTWTLKSLKAGKHVLCEKPFAARLSEAQHMFSAARDAGRVLVEAFMYRTHPLTLKLLETIRSGAIGRVRMIRTSFNYKTTRIDDNIRFDPALAGGSLMDIGCYCLDFSQLVAGCAPTSLTAHGIIHPRGVDEVAAGVLKFRHDIIATFTCGMTVAANNTAHVCGTEGYIEIPVPWKPPAENPHFIIAQGAKPRMEGGTGQGAPGPQIIRVDAPRQLYSYEADAFAKAVLDGAPPAMPADATLSLMQMLDEGRRQIGLRF